MLPEELEKIKKLIQQSNILSAMEKAEWSQLLADMNDKQLHELTTILTPRSRVAMPKVDIHQKEIGTSIPEHELELPAHTGQPAPAVQIPAKPQVAPHVSLVSNDPVLLQQRIETIAREMQQKKNITDHPEPIPVAPAPAPVSVSAMPAPRPQPVVAEKISITFKQPTDFAKIAPEDIRGGNPAGKLESVLKEVSEVSKKSSLYEIIDSLEKSPLYQAYIEMGFALLNDPNPDREMAYKNAADQKQRAGQSWLSKEEFEAFMDFRNRLDKAM